MCLQIRSLNLSTSNTVIACQQQEQSIENNIANIILVDASESLNESRVEAYAKGDIRRWEVQLAMIQAKTHAIACLCDRSYGT